MTTQQRIQNLIELGYEDDFINLADRLEAKTELPPGLQKVLDNLKDTPIDEPEVFEAIEKSEDEGKGVIARKLLSIEEITQYKASEIGDFIYAVEQKITSLKNDDGTYKSTPNTENCELPNFIEAEELYKLGDRESSARMRLSDPGLSKKEKEEVYREFKEAITALQNRSFEISKLDVAALSEWEKLLVASMVYSTAINASLSSMGKRLSA